MKFISAICLCAWVSCSWAAQLRTASPVERVVNLLKELKGQLEADGEAEQKVYDKYACWCEKASSTKADAIGTETAEMRTFSQKILSLKGAVATLASEIAETKATIKATKEEQARLTSIRQNENAQYISESTEMMQALAALEEAVTVLKKATAPGASLIQQKATARDAVQAAIQALPTRANLSDKQLALLSEFSAGANAVQSKYAPQSVTVQGMLADMYETFSADLETSTSDEATKNTKYEEIMETKDKEISELEGIQSKKEGEKASTEEDLADTTEAYDATYGQKLADIKFFDVTKAQCMEKADEMTQRKSLRTQELSGIKAALDILTSDSARDLFAKAIKSGVATGGSEQPSFLQTSHQVSISSNGSVQLHAYDALKMQASKVHSMRLAQLAATVRLAKVGHFDEVLKAIDTMMQTLKDEDAADIAKRDECKTTYQDIATKVADLSWQIEKNEAKIAKLDGLIELRTKEKTETIEEIDDLDKRVDAMTKLRDENHKTWQAKKKDDEDAIELLSQAIVQLSLYFSNNTIGIGPVQGEVKGLSFLQHNHVGRQDPVFKVSEFEAPDATLSDKGVRSDQSKSAISALTMIKQDLENEIKYSTQIEEEQLAAFLKEKAAADALRETLVTKKTALEGMIAARGKDKVEEERVMGININDKKEQTDYKAEVSPDCDFILRTFTERATKRAAEMKGLTEAKEYLAGANFPASAALLEQKAKFDDNKLPGIGFMSLRAASRN